VIAVPAPARGLRILVVDDEPAMVGVIGGILGQAGYRIIPAYDGREAVRRFREEDPDVILLDLAMADLDGAEVCRIIRREASTPIIVVTGESDGLISAELLDAGADDYVRKPFRAEELLARVRAVTRRRPLAALHGDWTVDRAGHAILWRGRPIQLSVIEFRLMGALIEAAGDLVETDALLGAAWPEVPRASVGRLKPHVVRVRNKLRAAGAPPIVAIRGVGYRLAVATEAVSEP
jgi:DNA-binding response OmpR family regulator